MLEALRRLPAGENADVRPELCHMLTQADTMREYNKILAAVAAGRLYLTIIQGRSLLLCGSFEAPDFVTALYHIFRALKKFQLNPEMSAIHFRTPLSPLQEQQLYNYFRSVTAES